MHVIAEMLASGSSGNSMLITAGDHHLLLDAGIGPRILSAALSRRGVTPSSLQAMLLTHEHDDHIKGIAGVSRRFETDLVANRRTLSAVCQRMELQRTQELETGGERQFGNFLVRSFRISHDAVEPVGYTIRIGSTCISYVTDLGCSNEDVSASMAQAQLCVIESNHDLDWLMRGAYPPHMKARVSGEFGHLSNRDASELMVNRVANAGEATFWLAHLSAMNNSPSLALRKANKSLSQIKGACYKVEVAQRDRPSVVWTNSCHGAQLTLF